MLKFEKKELMKFYLVIFFGFLMVQCTQEKSNKQPSDLWEFKAQHNQINFDKACMPLIMQYQELLKGLSTNDTTNLFQAAKNLVQLIDSFPVATITFKDSVLNNQIYQSLQNMNAELQGVLAEQSREDMQKDVHMLSIQFLNVLALTGFKEKNIYIFNVDDENLEDGLIWFGWNKKSIDPYHPKNKKEIIASQFLQE